MEEEYKKETQQLRELIRQVDKVGESAWVAGERLKRVKEGGFYKARYTRFSDYCQEQFNVSYTTASLYIKLHETYILDQVKGLFISHLKTIMDLVTHPVKREALVTALSGFSGKINKEDLTAIASIVETTDYDLSSDSPNNNGSSSEPTLSNKNSNSESIDTDSSRIQRDIKTMLAEEEEEKVLRKQKRDSFIRFGQPLESEFIPNIKLEKEPINEMGVVGLFCLIFPRFKSYFELEDQKMAFEKIKYIQRPFPDACIICKLRDKKQTETEVLIEFEFESYEYIKHKHHLDDAKCHLIVCWRDNAKSNPIRKDRQVVLDMPPVFELEAFLRTGKMDFMR